MYAEKLRRRFAHIFLSAMIALTFSSCADDQATTISPSPCTPAEWIQRFNRGDAIAIGPVLFVNSGGELIVDPRTRNQPVTDGNTISMTTTDGVPVTVTLGESSDVIQYTGNLSSYTILAKPQGPFGGIDVTVIKTCDNAS